MGSQEHDVPWFTQRKRLRMRVHTWSTRHIHVCVYSAIVYELEQLFVHLAVIRTRNKTIKMKRTIFFAFNGIVRKYLRRKLTRKHCIVMRDILLHFLYFLYHWNIQTHTHIFVYKDMDESSLLNYWINKCLIVLARATGVTEF